jgi:thaumarchaeosortase
VNFLGLDQPIIQMGEALRGEYWRANSSSWENFLTGDWPLSIEYLIFTLSFVATTFLTFGKKGLKTFSIAIALIAGITVVYMIDTVYPYGAFGPLQTFALPTAACAAVLLQMLGIPFTLSFSPTNPGSMPAIAVNAQGSWVSTSVAWPCAGVHSLFLYTVLILLFLGTSGISGFRKIIYFVVGLIGTFFVNVLRIATYFVLLVSQGREAALTFHGFYGELYFFVWILGYFLLIWGIQRYSLVERLKGIFLRSKQALGSTEQ